MATNDCVFIRDAHIGKSEYFSTVTVIDGTIWHNTHVKSRANSYKPRWLQPNIYTQSQLAQPMKILHCNTKLLIQTIGSNQLQQFHEWMCLCACASVRVSMCEHMCVCMCGPIQYYPMIRKHALLGIRSILSSPFPNIDLTVMGYAKFVQTSYSAGNCYAENTCIV